MATWEQELAQALEKEKTLLASIEECSQKKTNMLVKGDIESLSELISREQPLVMQLKVAEVQRLAIMKKYRLEHMTLSQAAANANSTYKELFISELLALKAITTKLKKRNDLNNQLTRSRIEFYGKLRALFAKPLYGNNGMTSQRANANRSFIDRKV
jgi:flagellar biosynthesis/type III secretory pathway chaperone